VGTSEIIFGLISGGSALTVLYLFSEFVSWQKIKAAEIRAGLVLRGLYKKLHASSAKLHSRTKPYLDRAK
jgi:hypothetical protein